ncbi:hypothetical protein SETIT_8G091000v2 [Setaria italica]|uniref:Peptidase A1 domain-containing protein n=2 Tax=Setaria italica TaxID=4555 RepID=K3ZL82_SETIT|nr:hypothetical protein SETIT_8G091000v2 [Setaria italica]
MAPRLSILVFSIFFLLTAPLAYSERRQSFRATMTRIEPAINLTRAAHKSHQRLSMLADRLDATSGGAQAPLQLDGDGGAYDMNFSIGTPPQKLSALADTGSDLIWVKCGPCTQCAPQGSPSYYPNTSSSFSLLSCSSGLCRNLESQSLASCAVGGAECDYRYLYGLAADSHHYTQGYLGSEIFTLGGDAAPGIGFGCTNMSEGGYGTGSGLVGLGRGPLSLVSQLNAGAFSYCLASDASKASPLLFGSGALTGAGVQSTPLISGASPSFYTVNLKSISIGAATSPGTGSGGIIFDSGTTVAFLAEPAYSLAKAALLSQTTNLTLAPGRAGFEVCFLTPPSGDAFPTMVLHFDGGDMALPTENYFGEVVTGVTCWIVQRSPSLSIVGNIMQMNFHVRYDVDKSVLSFQPANCNSL